MTGETDAEQLWSRNVHFKSNQSTVEVKRTVGNMQELDSRNGATWQLKTESCAN